jgi:hypothetical protein
MKQNQHTKKRGNEHTPYIHMLAIFFSAVIALGAVNNFTTLNFWASIARIVGVWFALYVVFAVAISAFTVWNVERKA